MTPSLFGMAMLASVALLLPSASAFDADDSENDYNDTSPTMRQLDDEPNPCNCYFQDSCGCVCSRPISWAQFQMLPQNFRPCRAFTLALRGGQFHSFPGDYFRRVGHVEDFVLDVGSVAFQSLHDPQAAASPYNGVSFDTSAYLRMYKVSVYREWNWRALADLVPSLQKAYCEVQILQSTVPVLRSDFGQVCRGAVTLATVVSSETNSLEDGVFANFYKLNELDLANNRIHEMRRSFFAYPALELEAISLANNQIRSLPQDMFSQMPSLQSVNLRGNPIAYLDEMTFRPVFRNVEIVGLDSLPLFCDCRARWLKEPTQLCGANVYGLAGAVCQNPAKFKGYSFFNDTLAKDLVC